MRERIVLYRWENYELGDGEVDSQNRRYRMRTLLEKSTLKIEDIEWEPY